MRGNSLQIDKINFSFKSMEQDVTSISWEDLPWKKFQKKSFNLQCKIYKAKQNNNFRLVRRLQKLLINSKAIYYLAVKDISHSLISKGVFLSGNKRFFLVDEARFIIKSKTSEWLEYSSQFVDFQDSFKMSFLIHKVIKYVWKSIIEPTYIENFTNPYRNWMSILHTTRRSKIASLKCSKSQVILKIKLNLDLIDLNFNDLRSKMWLPLKYKVWIQEEIKRFGLKVNWYKDGLISILLNVLLQGLDNINTILTHKNMPIPYSCKFFFRRDNEVFYFFGKGQDKIYLYNGVQKFLEARGINVNFNTIQLRDLSSTFDFSTDCLVYKKEKGILIYPSFSYWVNYKKYFISMLKKEWGNGDVKIKKMKFILLNWVQHNSLSYKTKLKSSFFYLKKLLAKYKG